MKTLAEWKSRFLPGVQIRQVWNMDEGKVNHVFTIAQVQTNGVYGTSPDLPNRSWMGFPTREEIEFTEQGWIRLYGTKKIAEYTWIEGESS